MAITLRDQHGRIPPGNGGRTPGSRNRRPGLIDHLPPDAFASIAAKLYEQALAGDVAAPKLLVDRYDPVPRHARVSLPMPAGDGLSSPGDDGARCGAALAVEGLDGLVDGDVEGAGVTERAGGQVVPLQVAPGLLDV